MNAESSYPFIVNTLSAFFNLCRHRLLWSSQWRG